MKTEKNDVVVMDIRNGLLENVIDNVLHRRDKKIIKVVLTVYAKKVQVVHISIIRVNASKYD